jgi:hypothetical protein
MKRDEERKREKRREIVIKNRYELLDWFENNTMFSFIGTSLLLLYDGKVEYPFSLPPPSTLSLYHTPHSHYLPSLPIVLPSLYTLSHPLPSPSPSFLFLASIPHPRLSLFLFSPLPFPFCLFLLRFFPLSSYIFDTYHSGSNRETSGCKGH